MALIKLSIPLSFHLETSDDVAQQAQNELRELVDKVVADCRTLQDKLQQKFPPPAERIRKGCCG